MIATAATRRARRQEDWTRESEAAALAALRRVAEGNGPRPVKLVYARQSKSDFDKDGKLKGPSMDQQFDSGDRIPELTGLPAEHYHDADRSGKETSQRPDYLRMIARIVQAAPGEIGAVVCYDQDRLHRNDIEFFHFMADMAERGILVFDAHGLISNADKLSWKMKAIFAQEEREKIARKVRDNLAFLKRHGALLGVIPQGYMRLATGDVVEDADAAPVIRMIFTLYATGRHSFQGLADHLNRQGIKPKRGPKKENHSRPQAVIFTGDVIKDILKNRAYLGLARVTRWRSGDEQWIGGKHPALVDQRTWDACERVRTRNRRSQITKRKRRTYALTPILRCLRCGGPMHGEASVKGAREDLYYACWDARRSRSAARPGTTLCTTRRVPLHRLETAIRDELRDCLPGGAVDDALRARLREAVGTTPDPRKAIGAAIARLDDQLDRARRLYEFGEYEWEVFLAKRAEIQQEQERLHEQAAVQRGLGDMEWCKTQVLDILAAWDAAETAERTHLLASIFDHIEAAHDPDGTLRIIGVPREGWRSFFEYVVGERETGLEPATPTLAR